MIAINEHRGQTCLRLINAYYKKFPNPHLKNEAVKIINDLQDMKFLMPGKPGGWAGGIIYALANQYRRACGIPGLLNKECEEFFDVSMGTIHKRAAMIRRLVFGINL